MPGFILTDDEYTFIVNLEKDLLTRAQGASPRASSHFQKVAKVHTDFLAREEGKRSLTNKKKTGKAERDALRLKRQQERLTALQAAAQKQQQPASQSDQTSNPRTRAS